MKDRVRVKLRALAVSSQHNLGELSTRIDVAVTSNSTDPPSWRQPYHQGPEICGSRSNTEFILTADYNVVHRTLVSARSAENCLLRNICSKTFEAPKNVGNIDTESCNLIDTVKTGLR